MHIVWFHLFANNLVRTLSAKCCDGQVSTYFLPYNVFIVLLYQQHGGGVDSTVTSQKKGIMTEAFYVWSLHVLLLPA